MKKIWMAILVGLFMAGVTGTAFPGESGTAQEAVAMVQKAIAYIKAQGQEKGLAEISNLKGPFVDRDLYVTVYDMNGKCLAHGANPKMIGKDLIGLKDPDGTAFVKQRVETAKIKDKFWIDYKFTNPVSKKIEPKSQYCERAGDIIVSCGIYKK